MSDGRPGVVDVEVEDDAAGFDAGVGDVVAAVDPAYPDIQRGTVMEERRVSTARGGGRGTPPPSGSFGSAGQLRGL